MTLRVVGAGLGRTGTHSLKIALEQLLGAPCYHMLEAIQHPEHFALWGQALDGTLADWNLLMGNYAASVDWPAAAWWRELADANPDAVVLLSTRSSADAWWKSVSQTIFEAFQREELPDADGVETSVVRRLLLERFTPEFGDPEATKAAYEAHNAAVRAGVPSERLIDWQPGDGWKPICDALQLPVPDEPFPHVNTTDDFRALLGLDG